MLLVLRDTQREDSGNKRANMEVFMTEGPLQYFLYMSPRKISSVYTTNAAGFWLNLET